MLLPMTIPVVWSPETRRHEPMREVWVGVPTEGTELPARVDRILEALSAHDRRRGDAPRRRRAHPRPRPGVRRPPAHDLCGVERRALRRAGRAGPGGALRLPDAGHDAGHAADPGRGDARPRGGVRLRHDDSRRPRHLGGGARGGRLRADRRRRPSSVERSRAATAYALCRPPGHHVTRQGYGGSCYLNNAAVAAQALRDAGHETVAVVDLDAHHGNGTQAIFWDRSDVVYASTHVDPAAGWFPHYFGHAHETGAGDGEGATLNLPLAEGTGDAPWLDAVRALAERAAEADALVVSLGVDAAADDPESPLARHRRRLRHGRPAARVPRPPVAWSSRRAATTCPASAAWWRPTSTDTPPADGSDPRVLGGC